MNERAVLFAPTRSLVGVISEPDVADDRCPIVVFLNAGMVHRAGPKRLYVRIARALADAGFTSLRFDLSGIGDSASRTDGLPLRAAALADVREALDFAMSEQRASSFILVGLCSGADIAFRAAIADPRVVGAVLIDGLPYHTMRSRLHRRAAHLMRRGNFRRLFASDGPVARRLRRPAPGAGSVVAARPIAENRRRDVPPLEEAAAALRTLTDRGARLLILNTPDRDYSYPRHFADTFPGVRPDRVDVAYFRDADHTFTLRANQDLLIDAITRWITWAR